MPINPFRAVRRAFAATLLVLASVALGVSPTTSAGAIEINDVVDIDGDCLDVWYYFASLCHSREIPPHDIYGRYDFWECVQTDEWTFCLYSHFNGWTSSGGVHGPPDRKATLDIDGRRYSTRDVRLRDTQYARTYQMWAKFADFDNCIVDVLHVGQPATWAGVDHGTFCGEEFTSVSD